MTRSVRLSAAALVALVLFAGLTGCAASPRQTVVETGEVKSQGLTPLERGKVRRDALAAARVAIAAWLDRDFAAMKPLFSGAQVDYYRAEADASAKAGRVRVRIHDSVKLDVVEMDESGQQVVLRYAFKNDSYTKNASGAVVSPATGKSSEIEITMQKLDGKWVVQKMFAGKEALE